MKAYQAQILKYLEEYEKARTTNEILTHLASLKGETIYQLTDRRRRSIISSLYKLENEKKVLTKKTKSGEKYWAIKEIYLENAENKVFKTKLKDLLKLKIRSKKRRPVKFFY